MKQMIEEILKDWQNGVISPAIATQRIIFVKDNIFNLSDTDARYILDQLTIIWN